MHNGLLWHVTNEVSVIRASGKPAFAIIRHKVTKTSRAKADDEISTLWCTCEMGLCAVHALATYLREYDKRYKSGDNLFKFSNGRNLQYTDLRVLIDTIEAAAGVAKQRWTPHSFRSGGATFLFLCDFPIGVIKSLGRWSLTSDTVEKHYVQPRRYKIMRYMQEFFATHNAERAKTLGRFGELLE